MDSGAQIARARLAVGLTQTELARRSGVAQANIAAYENGRRHPSAGMLARLLGATRHRPSEVVDRHRSAIRQIGAAHKARDMRIFGSVAEGTDTVDSDLDVLVTFEPGASLFDAVAISEELQICWAFQWTSFLRTASKSAISTSAIPPYRCDPHRWPAR